MKYTKWKIVKMIENPDKWIIYSEPDNGIAVILTRDGTPEVELKANAQLICEAVNQCISVNEDNPLAVAQNIKEMYEALKSIIARRMENHETEAAYIPSEIELTYKVLLFNPCRWYNPPKKVGGYVSLWIKWNIGLFFGVFFVYRFLALGRLLLAQPLYSPFLLAGLPCLKNQSGVSV